jgi:peptide/nickel transport system permease protein
MLAYARASHHGDYPGDGRGCAFRVQPALHRARRSRRGDRRRPGTPADVERIRQSLGLDRPFMVRFGEWVWQILHGDLGTSIFTNLPVSTMIAQRFEPTLSLMAVTLCFTIAVAIPMGVLAAWKAGTWIDRLIMAFAVFGFSVPVFVIGYLLAYVFALELEWLPVQGYTPLGAGGLAVV